MTFRWIIYSLCAIFNLFGSICSLYAFFSMFPKIALAYFFISVPITFYVLFSKQKWLDKKPSDALSIPKEFALGSNPF